jgi:hypothetical protein
MNAPSRFLRRLVGITVLLALRPALEAQPVIAPTPVTSVQPSAETLTTGHTPAPRFSSIDSALASDLPLYRFGAFAFHPHASYRVLHASGVEWDPGRLTNTSLQTVAPGLAVDAGDHWRLDYTPTWNWYSNAVFKDSLDHATEVAGVYDYDDWTYALLGNYTSLHPVLVETGRQTKEIRYDVRAHVRGQIGRRTTLELAGGHSYYEALPLTAVAGWDASHTTEWTGSLTARYAATERTTAGVGVTVGHGDPTLGPASTFTRPEAQLHWTPTDRIDLAATGGVEHRHYHGGAGNLNSPIYGGELRYRPFDVTMLSLGGTQSVSPSYLSNLVAKSRVWHVALEQRLLERFYATAGYTDHRTNYTSSDPGLPQLRTDRMDTFTARFAAAIYRRGTLAVFWQNSRITTSDIGFTYTTRQIGLEATLRF